MKKGLFVFAKKFMAPSDSGGLLAAAPESPDLLIVLLNKKDPHGSAIVEVK